MEERMAAVGVAQAVGEVGGRRIVGAASDAHLSMAALVCECHGRGGPRSEL
jgi:hypothetical protein